MKRQLAKRFAVTIYGLAILVLIWVGTAMKLEYDEGFLGPLFSFTLPVLGFMFHLPNEVIFSIGGGQAIPHQELCAITAGLLFCLLIDFFRFRIHRSKKVG